MGKAKNQNVIIRYNYILQQCFFTGGVTYWAFGYGLSYGESTGTSWFTAMGSWFLDESGPMQGPTFTVFLFQMSFATTATTIGLLYIFYLGGLSSKFQISRT